MSERQDDSYQGDAGAAGQQAGSDSGVSALLRASRMRIGEDLREVANALRIRYRYLEDIEAGRFADLPGNTYAIGFIRTYADHLGLDGEEVVRRYKEEAAASKGESNLEFPAPISESGIPAGALMFVGVVIAVLAYGAWYISTSDKNFIAELISPLPERLATMLPEEERKAAAAASGASTAPAATAEATALPGAEGDPLKTEMVPATEPAEGADSKAKPETGTADPAGSQNAESAPAEQPAEQPAESGTSTQAASSEAPAAPAPPASPKPALAESADSAPAASPAEPSPPSEVSKPSAPAAETPAPKKEMAAAPEKTPEKAPEKTEAKPVAEAAGEQAAATDKKPDAPQPAAQTTPQTTPQSTPQTTPVPETVVASEGSAGRVYGAENKGARIVVLAKMNSWIQVRDDVANQLLLTRLLRRGDSYRVPNRGGLKLLAGNAGALEISVDGKAVPPIGPQGAVRRSVVLDAEKLQQGKAVVE